METTFEYDRRSVFPRYIESDRLRYRPLHITSLSVQTLFELNRELSEGATRHVMFSPYETMIEAKEFIENAEKEFQAGESANYAMFLKDTNEFIGNCSFEVDWSRKKAESGVFLYPEYWGEGYGTERGETMVELAFEEHHLEVWFSRVAVENTASQRSIEKYVVENGGERIGVIPNCEYPTELRDIYLYSLRKENYLDAE